MATAWAERGTQQRGVAVAVVAHVVIIGLLSVQWTAGDRRFDNPPMEVDLIAETAAESSAPILSNTPPAARLGEEDAVDLAAPEPLPVPPEPEPIVRPTPAPTPKPVARPTPAPAKKAPPAVKKAPPKAAPKTPTKKTGAQPTGRPTGNVDHIGRELIQSQSKGVPASKTAAEVRQSVQLAVDREIRPFWQRNAPPGYEVELLRLTLEIRLRPDGSVVDVKQVGDLEGKTESNAPQQQRFVEQARKSVIQAAPFDISAEDFDGIIVIRQPFSATRR